MRLDKIKLSGFKSFVDPTTIPLPGNLVGIVGPNGCGKSNIIDAVRWVMGESSAKNLRGDNMADVIFNGAATRQPVGVASVELVFDNSDGRAGCEYAHYNQLSVKRQVTRQGQSVYYLNNTRCRKKDVTDIFLGTGLGPRSYAIIEQGTISRLIEAKPDELRVFMEEAAGISRYKERRRETELRMRHTRDNLDRLNDLRDELQQQLSHLQRQAKKAEQYIELKKQHRQAQQEWLAMRWQRYDQALRSDETRIQALETRQKDTIVQQHRTEATLNEARQAYKTQQALLQQTQEQFHALNTEITRIEQVLKHAADSREKLEAERTRMVALAAQATQDLVQDQTQLDQLGTELKQTRSEWQEAQSLEAETQAQSRDMQAAWEDWQLDWDAFQQQFAHSREQGEVQRVRIEQLDIQQQQTSATLERLRTEQASLSITELQHGIERLQLAVETLTLEQQELESLRQQLEEQSQAYRQQIRQQQADLRQLHAQEQKNQGKISSLQTLQEHATGRDRTALQDWLQQAGLAGAVRLMEQLQVEPGWETALETVLDVYLQAICVDNIAAPMLAQLQSLQGESLVLVEAVEMSATASADSSTLLSLVQEKVQTNVALAGILAGVYAAEDLDAALKMRPRLTGHESIITRQGTWLGTGWAIHRRAEQESGGGVLERQQTLRQLDQEQACLLARIDALEQQLEVAETALAATESELQRMRSQSQRLSAELSGQNSQLGGQQARLEQTEKRLKQLDNEIETARQLQAGHVQQLEVADRLRVEAEQQRPDLEAQREALLTAQQHLKRQLDETNHAVSESGQALHQAQARLETLGSNQFLTQKHLQRTRQQQMEAQARIEAVELSLSSLQAEAEAETVREQAHLIEQRSDKQRAVDSLQQTLITLEQSIDAHVQQQVGIEQQLDQLRHELETLRVQRQTHRVHQQTVLEQLQPFDVQVDALLGQLPDAAEENVWQQTVETLEQTIQRLGAINLTAVEEYKTQSERSAYLQAQHDDLSESLMMLQNAIDKIDRESQSLFKTTFNQVNEGLKSRFPKLFGGGQAYLELEGNDLLESGVKIMARPPGKRNSSIHLLSGGEKALTAIALVFSIFDLNPAPFCILDEVDAPLDDANVVRFSQLVEEMSATIQFIYITHNKTTMEISRHLAGVTQKEAGVSRMVAVDIDEAIELAAV